MDKETLKSLVKSYFSLTDIPATKESKEMFATATLADGVEISNDKDTDFAVGDDLFVKDSEGSWVGAPSGEHTTSSGIVVTVNEESKITGVKYPDEQGVGSLTEMAEAGDIAEEVVERAAEQGVSIEQVLETVEEIIDTVIAPQLEEMRAKMAEMEMAYKEKMSEPATMSAHERKFAAIQKVKANKGEGKTFNPKQLQFEAVMAKIKKNN
jgi:hypothetical protein